MIRSFLFVLGLLSALVLVLGFGGRFHGAGDTLALARPVAMPVLAVISLWWVFGGRRMLGLAGVCLSAVAAMTMVPPSQSADPGERTYSVYQKNLLFLLPDTVLVAEDILASGADFVTLQELHQRNRRILAQLRDTYPYQHFCPFAEVGGISVLSRWPAVEGQSLCEGFAGLAAMQVETPDGPLWVVSIHLHWPYPYRQFEHVQSLLPMLDRLDGPTVVAGDFNMFVWSYAVQAVTRATGTAFSGYSGGTFAFSYHKDGRNVLDGLPLLPIDHVLIPSDAKRVSVERRPRLGSDHHGVFATFAW